jgi:hypothetical protein
LLRLPIEKPRFHEAPERYVALVLQNGNLTRLASRNSGAAIAGRSCYTTASSAAALGHLGVVHKRGSGAKTARSREGWEIVALLYGRVERVHIDVDDAAETRRKVGRVRHTAGDDITTQPESERNGASGRS